MNSLLAELAKYAKELKIRQMREKNIEMKMLEIHSQYMHNHNTRDARESDNKSQMSASKSVKQKKGKGKKKKKLTDVSKRSTVQSSARSKKVKFTPLSHQPSKSKIQKNTLYFSDDENESDSETPDPQSYTMKELWGHPKNISSLPNSPSFSFGKDFTNQFTIRGGFKTPGVGFYERHEIRRSPAKSSSYATLNHTNYIYSGSNSKRQKSRGEEYQHTFEYTPEVRMIASDRKNYDTDDKRVKDGYRSSKNLCIATNPSFYTENNLDDYETPGPGRYPFHDSKTTKLGIFTQARRFENPVDGKSILNKNTKLIDKSRVEYTIPHSRRNLQKQ